MNEPSRPDGDRRWSKGPPLPLPLVCVAGLIALILSLLVLREEVDARPAWMQPRSPYEDVAGLSAALGDTAPSHRLTERDLPALRDTLDALWSGEDLPGIHPRLHAPARHVYVALRADGKRVAEEWGAGGTVFEALEHAVSAVRSSAPRAGMLTLEIALPYSYREHRLPEMKRALYSRATQGLVGLELSMHGVVERYSPTQIVASNSSHDVLVKEFLERRGRDHRSSAGLRVHTFGAEQVLHVLGEPSRTVLMTRGNQLVLVESVTQEATAHTADLAARWLFRNVRDTGRMTYRYFPSTGTEPEEGDNMVRQWMATVAMGKAARRDGAAPDAWDTVERNIDYNLREFYREDEGHGLILYDGKVKLGAVALAALAIHEHPKRDKWSHQRAALERTILHLWREDGAFTSFYLPRGRNGQQNFYPGEALLYWASLYAETRAPELLARIEKSFTYYRAWHRQPENRNPAFIPWHTQAYAVIWAIHPSEPMKEFIFEMNDWLVETMLEWNPASELPDLQGRYFSADRPDYGIPHASSTGVYLEGLIDAYAIARASGDEARSERYRLAIVRGIRSVMQLQFTDDVDMFYVESRQRDLVVGGVRTDVHNSDIRCDNVQHNLMGLYKILDVFQVDDYRHRD